MRGRSAPAAQLDVRVGELAIIESAIKNIIAAVEQCRAEEDSAVSDVREREARQARVLAALEAAAAALDALRRLGCLDCP